MKYSALLLFPLFQYTLVLSSTFLSLNQCHFISHVFERFGFIPDFKKPSVFQSSVLRGFAGCLWLNAIKADHMTIAIFPLLKFPQFASSVDEDATLRIFLHSLWIGPFLSGVRFTGRGEGQSLRYKCPV